MKLIIGFLLSLQLLIGGILGINSFRAYYFRQLMEVNSTEMRISFEEENEYWAFLDFMAEEGITLSRRIFTDFESVTLYTTDPTMNGLIALSEGEFPDVLTTGFISNRRHQSEDQIGVIFDLFPDFNVIIRYLNEPNNFNIDGIYQIHTTDIDVLWEIEHYLIENAVSYEAFPNFEMQEGVISFLMGGFMRSRTWIEIAFIVLIPLVTFICLVASLIQYSMNQLKKGVILFIHGYGKASILKHSLTNLLAVFLSAGVLVYIVSAAYVLIGGFSMFLVDFTVYFLLLYAVMIGIYLVVTLIALMMVLQFFNSPQAIKGFKPDFVIQALNHGLKIIFTACFLIVIHFLWLNFSDLNSQRDHLSHWEVARTVYRIPLSGDGGVDSTVYVQFYERILDEHRGFLMNSEWVGFYEEMGFPMMSYAGMNEMPFEINPFGNRVDITLSYLALNPIQTVSGEAIESLIIWDDFVLNILVPIHLQAYEQEILAGHLLYFYGQSTQLLNMIDADPLMVNVTMDDLSINIIYVESNQYYFAFDPLIRPEAGNAIKDPVAVIYTGNFHVSHLISAMSMGFYFVADTLEPFSEIEHLIDELDLAYSIRFVYSTFATKGEVIANLEADVLRILLMGFALVITNIIVSYNLIANYFWRHKYMLFTKKLFGFSLLNRHKWFILSFLGYLIPIIAFGSFIFGVSVLIIGIFSLLIELAFMLMFEQRLMNKSFAEIMKGER